MKGLFFVILGVIITYTVIHPPLTFPYPNTKLSFTVTDLSDTSLAKAAALPADTFATDTAYRSMYLNDTCTRRKALYGRMLLAFDSVHKISDDPRVDSVWRYVRPRLVYASMDFARTGQCTVFSKGIANFPTNGDYQIIFLLPAFQGEAIDSPSAFVTPGAVAVFCQGVGLDERIWRSITVRDADTASFFALSISMYHEGYHAFFASRGQGLMDDDIQHAEIANLESSLIESFASRDTAFLGIVSKADTSFVYNEFQSGAWNERLQSDVIFFNHYYKKNGGRKMTAAQNLAAYCEVFGCKNADPWLGSLNKNPDAMTP